MPIVKKFVDWIKFFKPHALHALVQFEDTISNEPSDSQS